MRARYNFTEGWELYSFCENVFATPGRKLPRSYIIYTFLISIELIIDLSMSARPSAVNILAVATMKLSTWNLANTLQFLSRSLLPEMIHFGQKARLQRRVNWGHLCLSNGIENWFFFSLLLQTIVKNFERLFCGRWKKSATPTQSHSVL